MAKITTVRDLITQLEAIGNKDLDVVMDSEYGVLTDLEAIEGAHRYYGKACEDGVGWQACTRECVVLIGWE